jgi:hypothetical protein
MSDCIPESFLAGAACRPSAMTRWLRVMEFQRRARRAQAVFQKLQPIRPKFMEGRTVFTGTSAVEVGAAPDISWREIGT